MKSLGNCGLHTHAHAAPHCLPDGTGAFAEESPEVDAACRIEQPRLKMPSMPSRSSTALRQNLLRYGVGTRAAYM